MAIYHLSVKPVQRSKGRSATAAAAYRSGQRITDQRTGEKHDYSKRHGVEASEIITPDGNPIEREALWNMAEAAEKRKDGTTAREYEIALPSELDQEQRKELALEFCRMLTKRHGVAVDISIHDPSPQGDQRNHHAHILATTRKLENGTLTVKSDFDLSDRDRKKKNLPGRKHELESLREEWAKMVNRSLEKALKKERVSHLSLKKQGIQRAATIHVGPSATAMERKGLQTERGELNRQICGLQTRELSDELSRLERQHQGIQAAKERFANEKFSRERDKIEADELARRLELEAAEKARKMQIERAALEKEYGLSLMKFMCPKSPWSAKEHPAYKKYFDELQAASNEKRKQMLTQLEHGERRYEAYQLFSALAKKELLDTSSASRDRFMDKIIKEWEEASPDQRAQMELDAKEKLKGQAIQRDSSRKRMGFGR